MSDNSNSIQAWEGTTAYGWLITALLLFISFWDLDLIVHNAPFALDFNFTGFLFVVAVFINQSRYFRITKEHLDIDGVFNAADIPFEAITSFTVRHIFIIGYILTIEYQGTSSSQKRRVIFLSHLKNHKDFSQTIVDKLPSTAQKNIVAKYLS